MAFRRKNIGSGLAVVREAERRGCVEMDLSRDHTLLQTAERGDLRQA